MVNVTDPASSTNANPPTADSHGADPPADSGRLKNGAEEQARQRAAEIIRGAQQQADRKIAEADAKLAEAERVASQRADQEIERRFIQAMMLGMREVKVSNTRSVAKKVIITLDQRMVLIDDKAYLRYSIQNTGDKDFAFTALSLETEGNEGKPLTAVINQSKPENSLAPGESLTGVIVFDSRQIGGKQRVALFLRGADSAELAHVTIQQ
jgi:archaellum component FlaG (FlaF/FlaG flagellin family)